MSPGGQTLLEVQDLAVAFDSDEGCVEAVRGVTFDIRVGEFSGLVGESGSGKSVTSRALINMVTPPGRITSGEVWFEGHNVLRMDRRALRNVRGRRISTIFQDPMTSLNPVFTVGHQLELVIRSHGGKVVPGRTEELLRDVEIPAAAKRARQYPHELSGGMRQRVMIAMALANRPSLIIADEPTTALDVTIQAQILELLKRINREHGTSVLLISHNLDLVAEVAERILVFYAGKVVERGAARTVLQEPSHPYTRGLLASVPRGGRRRLVPLAGSPPALAPPPVSCAFAPRCSERFDKCEVDPPLVEVAPGRATACWAGGSTKAGDDSGSRDSS